MKPLLLAAFAALCFSCLAFAQPPAEPKNDDDAKRKAAIEQMIKRLDEIKIRDANFQRADVQSVVAFLNAESRLADPSDVGVNIVFLGIPPDRSAGQFRLRDIKLRTSPKTWWHRPPCLWLTRAETPVPPIVRIGF